MKTGNPNAPFTEAERQRLLDALYAIDKSGDGNYDRLTHKLIAKLRVSV